MFHHCCNVVGEACWEGGRRKGDGEGEEVEDEEEQ